MPPTLLLIRHAQAQHNLTENYDLPDPPLTPQGHQQCRELAAHLSRNLGEELRQHQRQRGLEVGDIGLVVVSPMRRTLETATEGLGWLIGDGEDDGEEGGWSGRRVRLDAMWQENSAKPCDTGSPIPTLSKEFPQFDWSAVDSIYPNKTSPASNPYRFTRSAVLKRGQHALEWLYARPEKIIAVVSHSGFLRTAVTKTKFANADYRIFDFQKLDGEADGGGDGQDGPAGAAPLPVAEDGRGLELVEWEVTKERGGGMGRSQKGRWEIVEGEFPEETGDVAVEEKGEPEREEKT
ncbi:hypothetical protein LTS18_008853, partial [Coniosporium uncinatum]